MQHLLLGSPDSPSHWLQTSIGSKANVVPVSVAMSAVVHRPQHALAGLGPSLVALLVTQLMPNSPLYRVLMTIYTRAKRAWLRSDKRKCALKVGDTRGCLPTQRTGAGGTLAGRGDLGRPWFSSGPRRFWKLPWKRQCAAHATTSHALTCLNDYIAHSLSCLYRACAAPVAFLQAAKVRTALASARA